MYTHLFWLRSHQLRQGIIQRNPFAPLTYHLINRGLYLNLSFFSSLSSNRKSQPVFLSFSLFDNNNTDKVLSSATILELVDKFWNEIFAQNQDKILLVQLRIKSENNYYSLSKFQSLQYQDKDRLANIFVQNLTYERYTQFPITDLFLRYSLTSAKTSLIKTSLQSNLKETSHLDTPTSFNFPTTLDLNLWGTVNKIASNTFIISRDNQLFTVIISKNIRTITVYANNGKDKIASFKDTIINLDDNHFEREMENGTLITYKTGVQINLIQRQRDSVFMERLPKDKKGVFNMITLDLETQRLANGDLRVISAATYDGVNQHSFFINDYDSSNHLLCALMDLLFTPQNKGKSVYIHNLSGFDGVFLLKTLAADSTTFNMVRKEDKIISISVSKRVGESTIKLIFKDSLLLLPVSLKKLAKGFDVSLKGDFDHSRTNACVSFAQFEAIRAELLAYNIQDCVALYEVLIKFGDLVFTMFKIDINNTPTISSLALRIYRSKFMPSDARIGITDVKLYDKLHSAYTGGAVDVFCPESIQGEPVYAYDVNSMYPAVMKDKDYPVGSPVYVEGNVDISNSFGFLKVRVKTPKDLRIPLLQTKIKGRTIAPIGSWTGWYFSEELKMALELGYKFEVIEAILYERGKIFSGYVSSLYEMRKSYDSSDPRNMICKLLLNSLYGKFGMSPYLTSWKLVDNSPNVLDSFKADSLPDDILELGDNF